MIFFFLTELALAGVLGLFWNIEICVSLLGYSVGHIDVYVTLHNSLYFRFTGFYGNLKSEIR